jgi:FkbM family methyltransferase
MNRIRDIIPLWRLERARERLKRLTWSRARIIDERDNRYIRQILAYVLREDSTCVDVGGHQGGFVREFFRFAPRGKCYVCEPLPHFAAKLSELFPNAEVFNVALSDRGGESPFVHVLSDSAWSGLKLTPEAEDRHLAVETLMVKTCPMDDLIPEDVKIDLIKIDVEGAELQVLRGAARTILRSRPYILFEHGSHAAAYGTTPDMIYSLLGEWSFCILGVDGSGPLSQDKFASSPQAGRWNFLARPVSGEPRRR